MSLGIRAHLPAIYRNSVLIRVIASVKYQLIATVYNQYHIAGTNHHTFLDLIMVNNTIHVSKSYFITVFQLTQSAKVVTVVMCRNNQIIGR